MFDASHPSRVRGLKFTDRSDRTAPIWSHPSRVRGLKYLAPEPPDARHQSHPSRVRGLKSDVKIRESQTAAVAPFTGAWIEIWCRVHHRRLTWQKSHPSRVRGLKFGRSHASTSFAMSHPSRVRGLKFQDRRPPRSPRTGRTLHGCVD